MPIVNQLVASFSPRDAIGNHVIEVQRALRSAGHESEIFADGIAPNVTVPVRPAVHLPDDGWLIYQFSIGSSAGELYRRHRGGRILNYHNITPLEFFDAWEPQVGAEIQLGRRQLADLADVTDLAIGVSPFNRGELRDLGYAPTTCVPVLVDLETLRHSASRLVSARLRATKRGGARIIFVGRLAPNKAQHDLIAACMPTTTASCPI